MMFRRFPSYPLTLFSEGVEIHGNLASAGVLEIKGTVRGDIDHQGKVVVGLTGYCEGNIVARSVEVAGEVHGDVEADRLLIHSTGRLHGRANCSHLVVHDGGVLEQGNCEEPVAVGCETLVAILEESPKTWEPRELPERQELPEPQEVLGHRELPGPQELLEPLAHRESVANLSEAPRAVKLFGRKEPVFYTSF